MKAKVWHLYILRCGNGNLYTGITTEVRRRIWEHKEGKKGAKSLRGKGPLLLVLRKRIGSMSRALKVEYRIKHLAKAEKERLVAGKLSFNKAIHNPA